MNILQYRIALQSLRMNRVRTTLTTLGIIIGVASITLVLSLGGGIEHAVKQQLGKLEGSMILVSSGAESTNDKSFGAYNPFSLRPTSSLTEEDFNTIRLNRNIETVAPLMLLNGSVTTASGKSQNVPIVATTPSLTSVLHLEIKPGQFIDTRTARETAVLGAKLANELYGSNQIIGQQFTLKGRAHTIIGVLKQTNEPINVSGIDLDRAVFVNFDDGKSFNQGVGEIQQMLVTAKNTVPLEDVRDKIEKDLLETHNRERDFTVLAGSAVATHGSGAFGTIVLATALVATVTLVVGGIGIMNIMLVGVSERTREIGIRKALGATNGHIFGQFLIEALMMCIVGGLLGLITGYGLAFLIGLELALQPAITWATSAIGLGMAFSIGIVFGVYPALKAARKDPIESLRQYH